MQLKALTLLALAAVLPTAFSVCNEEDKAIESPCNTPGNLACIPNPDIQGVVSRVFITIML